MGIAVAGQKIVESEGLTVLCGTKKGFKTSTLHEIIVESINKGKKVAYINCDDSRFSILSHISLKVEELHNQLHNLMFISHRMTTQDLLKVARKNNMDMVVIDSERSIFTKHPVHELLLELKYSGVPCIVGVQIDAPLSETGVVQHISNNQSLGAVADSVVLIEVDNAQEEISYSILRDTRPKKIVIPVAQIILNR